MSELPRRDTATADPSDFLQLTNDAPRPTAVLIDEAQLEERQGRFAEARELYERALSSLGDSAEAAVAAGLLRWIGLTHQYEGDIEAAFDCFDAALAVAEACGDAAAIGQTINAQAATHYKQGRLEEAERLYLQARESARRSGEAKLAAMTSQNLGIIANIRGELEQALWHYEASLADYRALGLSKYICMTLNNLGMLYTRMERWDTAGRAYDEATEIAQVLGDVTVRIQLEVNRAALWIARGDFPRAQDATRRALDLSRQTQDKRALGDIHKCFGLIARGTGDFEAAEESFTSAAQIAEERQDLLLLAEVAREMAELYRKQSRNRDTLQSLNRAHRLFTQLQARADVADIDRQTTELETDFLEVVRRWGESIESKDHYTQGHCERVADLACALAEEAGLDAKSLFWFRIGALLHDVGKLTIPPEVLNKPGRLTSEEWTLVKNHPVAGVEMLADIDFPWDVRPIVESHHERWDGAGYPHALTGEDIPLVARILCVADVYDALTSERSYKRAVPHEQAMGIMRGEIGGQFDPDLFAKFELVMTRRTTLVRQVILDPDPLPAPTESQADIDDLTGVPLRRAFMEQANAILARRRPHDGQRPALLVIDVDNFKLVNDTFGHLQGDDVLRTVSGILKQSLRTGDIVGRYGGDEFMVMLPHTNGEIAREVAERLRSTVEREEVTLRGKGGAAISVTLSIGVACAEAADHMEALFAAADHALYEAKRAGRNAVSVGHSGADALSPQLNLNRFVGRVDELARLLRLLEASHDGGPRVVAIVGEAGVGKSTLVRQLLPEVRLRGGMLVAARCLEADVKPPYGPWAEVLGSIRPRIALGNRNWRELPRLLPGLAEGAPIPTSDSPGSKYALYEEIVAFIREAAAACPIVMVLDDMQWADSATWDTLEHLIPQLDSDRVLICLTIRAEDKNPEVMDRRRRLSRDERFSELTLQRLTREEVEQWLAAASHGQELGRELLPALYRHTEGNPFLIVQVLRTLIEEGEIRYEPDRWSWRQTSELRLPVAVSDLMARRLDRLSTETRNILTTAAVIGRVFDLDLAIDAGAGSEDALLDAVDEAVAAAVLEPSRGGGDQYSFAHTLLRDAIRSTANPRRLRRIHQSVAEAMERRMPDAVAEIASHFDQASVSDRAYTFAIRAGERAMNVYAHDEASGFFGMARRHASTPRERLDSSLGLANVAEGSAHYAESLELCEVALTEAEADSTATPAAVLPIRRMRERLKGLLGQPLLQTREACYQLMTEAERTGVETERVALLTMVSQTYSRLGDLALAQRLAREGVQRAEDIQDRRLLADAAMRLGTTLLEAGLDEAIEQYRRAEDLFAALDDRHGMVRCQINIGVHYSNTGNSAEAEAAYRRAVEVGASAHTPDLAGLASLNLGVLYLKEGRYEDASASFEEARRLFITVKNEPHRLATLYNMGHLAREAGNSLRAVELYEETASLARGIGQLDVEIGAQAGAGLAALAVDKQAYARDAMLRADALIEQRADPWFQGRELAEALAVLVHLAEDDRSAAERRFYDALGMAELRDRYGAAWLVAEAGTALAAAGLAGLWHLVDRYAAQVDELGYAPLSRRYAALRSSRS